MSPVSGYDFITIWRFESPIAPVWDLISHAQQWPAWWKGVEAVEELEKGDESGVGGVRRYTWKSRLPYRLTFDMRITRVEPMSVIEGDAFGELKGQGRWRLSREDDITVARYDWRVEATKPWMRLLSPVARPLFSWNHDVVMRWGAEGLARRLGVPLLSAGAG